jgi:hypothetical protein
MEFSLMDFHDGIGKRKKHKVAICISNKNFTTFICIDFYRYIKHFFLLVPAISTIAVIDCLAFGVVGITSLLK